MIIEIVIIKMKNVLTYLNKKVSQAADYRLYPISIHEAAVLSPTVQFEVNLGGMISDSTLLQDMTHTDSYSL